MSKNPTIPDLAPATVSEADGVRYLHLGTPWVQGAMRIRKPAAIELEYVQRMMVWMLLRPPESLARGHAVQLGLGAATITRFCHGVLKMRCTAVEINRSVIGVCRTYFRLPDDGPRLKVLEMDAQAYVDQAELAGSAQVLCVDLYDHDAASPVLDSEAFYRACARLLDDGGVMTVNLFGRDARFERSARRIEAAFAAQGTVFALRPTREGNTIVVALKQGEVPDREELAARAQQIETRYGLPARKWLRMMRPLPAPGAPTE
jgi:spermidine synthase